MSEETATPTTTTNSKQNNKDKNKSRKIKRKRHEGDTASLHQQWKEDRYDRLVHQAQKQLHKQAKQVKTMFIQKKIRQLKKTEDGNSDNNNNKNTSNDDATPDIPYKQVDLDIVVQQATRQLGLYHANPRYTSETANTIPAPTTDPLVQNILQHAKFQQAMEEWNEKVVDYRRFCMQLDEPHSVPPKANSNGGKSSKKSKKTVSNHHHHPASNNNGNSNLQDTPTTSLFGTLNGDSSNTLDPSSSSSMLDPSMSAYGPAATMEDILPKKKNRQGQRGRKAKALAIQAKKEGRKQYHVSLNWREKKEDKKGDEKGGNGNGNGERPHKRAKKSHDNKDGAAPAASASNNNSSSNKKNNDTGAGDAAEAHPSWAAKQQQKTGIVAFQGTKITF